MPRTRPGDLIWTENLDGEFNALATNYRGHQIEVYSDRDGMSWEYILDDDPGRLSEIDTMEGAKREAIADIDSIEDQL